MFVNYKLIHLLELNILKTMNITKYSLIDELGEQL